MEHPKIDLLRDEYQAPARPRKPILFFGRTVLIAIVFVTTVAGAFAYRAAAGGGTSGSFPTFSLLSTLSHLVGASTYKLKGQSDDRINLLLLGVGGDGHDGPQLSDTMILVSYQPSTDQVALLSIPRDLDVPIPGYGMHKINEANARGEAADPGSGPLLAAQTLQNVLGVNVDYYLRVDFNGFSQFIDDIGGIDVDVQNSFSDSQYPVLGQEDATCDDDDAAPNATPNYDCRFETISFTAGMTHMDGATALEFVRSRHGDNGEASDFARSRRQQLVLLAVKQKMLSASTLLNPATLNQLRLTFQKNIDTNLQTQDLLTLANDLKNFDTSKLINRVLDDSPTSPVYATSLDGEYVLLPKNNDWQPVRDLYDNIFAAPDATDALASAIVTPDDSPLKIEIQNGTDVSGLAFRFSQLLSAQGYDVTEVDNAAKRNYDQTIIYDFTNGAEPDKLNALRDYLKADVALSSGGWLVSGDVVPSQVFLSTNDYAVKPTDPKVDFLVILGQTSADLAEK